jgi:hypothetical protein
MPTWHENAFTSRHFYILALKCFNTHWRQKFLPARKELSLFEATKKGGPTDAYGLGRTRFGIAFGYEPPGLLDLGVVNPRPTGHVPFGHGHGKTVPGSLGNESALKVGQCGEDVEDQGASSRSRVELLLQGFEIHLVSFEVVHDFQELTHGATKTIQTYNAKGVALAGESHHFGQARPVETFSAHDILVDSRGTSLF